MQTYQKDQKHPTSHSCTELSETPVFPCEYRYKALKTFSQISEKANTKYRIEVLFIHQFKENVLDKSIRI